MARLASGGRSGERAINGLQDDAAAQAALREDQPPLCDGDQDASTPGRDVGSPARAHVNGGRARPEIAAERDAAAQARDVAACARDLAADARDRAMAALDAMSAQQDGARAVTGAEVVIRAGALRSRAARYRERAAEHRALAAEDRAAAARERELSARDRASALSDYALVAETDMQTGARTRTAGLHDLECELDRCRRSGGTLAVAYVEIVGVKASSPATGQTADGLVLRDVADCIRAHMRSYDVIVRFAADGFVCAMPSAAVPTARERCSEIAAALAAAPGVRAIRTGCAELQPGEHANDLIRRAEHDATVCRG